MTEIIIRLATDEDAELIADLSRETFFDSYSNFNTKANMDKFLGEVFTRDRLIEEVKQPWHIFILAFDGDEAVGYVKLRESSVPLSLVNQDCLEIARIYSVKHRIGKGVGSRLMESAVAIAKERKKQVLWLGVWEKNQRAIDFYTKWGFESFGQQKFPLGDDLQTDWLMRKML